MKKVGIGVITLMCVLLLSGCGGDKGKSYVVTFNTDGGTKISSVEVKENEKVSKPKEPTKEGYSFDGWYKDDVKYDFDTSITGNITLKAKWVKGEGKGSTSISFDVDGGNAVSDLDAKVGEKIGKLPTPKKDGYTFLGWYNGNTKVTEDTIVTAGMKLTAKWEKNSGNTGTVSKPNGGSNTGTNTGTSTANKVTVTFDSNGGTKVDSITVTKGSKIKEPSAPTKDGYKFAGWFLENGGKANFASAITRDIKLTARWTKNEGSKPVNPTPVDPTPSEPDEPVDPTPEKKSYKVTYMSDGKEIGSETVKEGEKVAKVPTPTKDGYKFVGWDYDVNTPITKETVITAKWEQNIVSYSYDYMPVDKTSSSTYKLIINGLTASSTITVEKNGTLIAYYNPMYSQLTFASKHASNLEGANVKNGEKVIGVLKK